MDKLSKDELVIVAIKLDLPELLAFCSTSKRINNAVCRQDRFWLRKLQRDFPNIYENFKQKISYKNPTYRKVYEDLYKLHKVKEAFGYDKGLLDLYDQTILIKINDKTFRKIPLEIDVLDNLETLMLNNNNISEIPPELGNLKELYRLSVTSNNISRIPPEIFNGNLETLQLANNNISEIPKEIKNSKIQQLFIADNPIDILPEYLYDVPTLKYINISDSHPNIKVPNMLRRKPGLVIQE